MPEKIRLDHVVIVLNRPRYPENIGASARAMRNMGLERLIVVNPENCDLTRVLKLATHAAADIIEGMDVFENLEAALSPFHYVVGTTARLGGRRNVIAEPSTLAGSLIPLSRNNQIAILFGPEDRGLSNEDLRSCHAVVTFPTAEFASLNLAQAVMIMCYELFRAGRDEACDPAPRLASRFELDGMYEQLKEVLVRISFVNPENPDYWMDNFRRFFSRLPLRAKEVKIIRGVCRQIDWYGKKCYSDGLKKH